jgi:long-chain acyl-CoA synthetase
MAEGDVYLSPAPLYHAAPLAWTMSCHRSGATVVVMERFDAEQALRLIEAQRVTHSQWVPTMFVRMLKLPALARSAYDLSSLRWAVHAAAPCPVPVKQAMISWWGPILFEFYSMTEGFGAASIFSEEWLRKPGSVGRPLMGVPHVTGLDGAELPPGKAGTIWFEGGTASEYHGDPDRTAAVANERGWRTVGDVGYLDDDGYLYLTDRASNLIISGGVNIYPQEIENLLITHPKVADVAVVGAPHEEMGEEVVAVVQPADGVEPGEALAAELSAFARANLSHVKAPRRIDFMAELPRHPTGKLYKRLIRDAYWGKKDSVIV